MDVSIELTLDEITVLAGLLDLPMPIGVAADEIDYPDVVRERLAEAATRSLEARGIITPIQPGGHEVNEAVATIIRLTTEPALSIAIEVESDTAATFRSLLCSEELGVDVLPRHGSVYELTPFVTRDTVRRVIHAADLRPAAVPVAETIEIGTEMLEQLAMRATLDTDGTAAELRSIGASEAMAHSLATALASRRALVTVTAIYQPEHDVFEGGTLTWMDAGLYGNWLTELPDDESADGLEGPPERVRVRAVTAEELLGTFASYLPEILRDT